MFIGLLISLYETINKSFSLLYLDLDNEWCPVILEVHPDSVQPHVAQAPHLLGLGDLEADLVLLLVVELVVDTGGVLVLKVLTNERRV